MPPSTENTCPVIYPPSSEARKSTMAAISLTEPNRPRGMTPRIFCFTSSESSPVMSVVMKPGATALTVTARPANSRARLLVMAMTPDGKGGKLLTWESAQKIPWGVLILFGGGITIANAFIQSGLADLIASHLGALSRAPVWLMILLISLTVTFMTEVTSNTATASLLMPLLAAASVAMEIDPYLLMIPAALSASCAFMLPVATAPNAVIYGSGQLSIKDMAKAGLALNLMGAVVISAVSYLFFG